MRQCYICHTASKELRPYGADGQDVCFACAMSTPERKAMTTRMFGRQLSQAGPVAVLTDVGPVQLAEGTLDALAREEEPCTP